MGLFDIFNNSDQQQAAQAQIAGINAGYGQLQNYFGTGISNLNQSYAAGLAPFLSNWNQANAGTTAYGNAVGANGPAGNAAAQQAFYNNPGYNFQLQQGNNAITAQNAATGGTGSGNEAIALSKFNQGLANTSWNNYVSNLQPYLNYSTANAQGIGGLYGSLGNQQLGAYENLGNAAYGANTSIGNANANADLANLNASANMWNLGMNAVGAGLGFLSDERAKEDIEPIGEAYDGQPIYRYRYKGDPRHQIGLIAQEVEQVEPDAVAEIIPFGLKAVNYKRATDYAAQLGRFLDHRSPADEEPESYGTALLKMAA